MSTTFGVNSDNDLYLGEDGNLVFETEGLVATAELCEHYAKARVDEMVFQLTQGVPYFDDVFNALNKQRFRTIMIEQLLRVDQVIEVTSLVTVARNNQLFYEAQILTTFGTTSING